MPKKEIDYSNTIIYKITCKDLLINETYIGHTTNFIQRKHIHKISCINQQSKNYNCKLYEVIRKNGGWNNWNMEILGLYNCSDHYEARKIEQTFFVSLKTTLNSIEPLPKSKHISTMLIEEQKQKNVFNELLGTKCLHKSCEKVAKFFCCLFCNYNTSRKSSYDKHVLTTKHKTLTESCEKVAESCDFFCQNCNKKYKSRVGLWKHNKNCNLIKPNEPHLKNNETNKDELINYLIKENQEFKNLILEIVKKDTYNNTNCNNTNSNNKSFNLQFFLNETCKDAMNITDFVNSIKLQLSDLERVGEFGYVEGISSIIVKNLKELDITQRPVHCTDKKREILYIKDDNKWEKDEEKKKMHKLVKKIADKNARMLLKFREAHPDCSKSTSKYSDQYNKIIVESMGGHGDNDFDKEEKIIKKVSKGVIVEKL
jgi:hypothetical protein